MRLELHAPYHPCQSRGTGTVPVGPYLLLEFLCGAMLRGLIGVSPLCACSPSFLCAKFVVQ
jgi:hypothetical protein